MKPWSAKTIGGEYSFVIAAKALRDLNEMCTLTGEIETGGVLIGYYSSDLTTAIVLDATQPPSDSLQGPYWFNRGIAGLYKMLKKRWNSKKQTYYIGEWHFHPANNVEPSEQDIKEMYNVRIDHNYHCEKPILLILGRFNHNQERAARIFVFPSSKQYVELIQLPSNHLWWTMLCNQSNNSVK